MNFALGFFADNEKRAVKLFQKFNSEKNDDECLEYKESARINDTEAIEIIKKVAGIENINQIQNFEKDKRDKVIRNLKDSGLSIRQIERLTGISFNVIRKI